VPISFRGYLSVVNRARAQVNGLAIRLACIVWIDLLILLPIAGPELMNSIQSMD
jgi:hypothetical protein